MMIMTIEEAVEILDNIKHIIMHPENTDNTPETLNENKGRE